MESERPEVGTRIRSARQQRQLSLTDVAKLAGISVATLSRVETSKQSMDVNLLVTLAGILQVPPAHLLGTQSDGQDMNALADRLAALRATDRAELLRIASRRRRETDLEAMVDELLSTLDVLREELEQVARATRKRRKS